MQFLVVILVVELVEFYEFGMCGGDVVGFVEGFYCDFLVVIKYYLVVLVWVYVLQLEWIEQCGGGVEVFGEWIGFGIEIDLELVVLGIDMDFVECGVVFGQYVLLVVFVFDIGV